MTELKTLKDMERNLNDFTISRNFLLKKMKKENWIVNVCNKAMISWAGIHTLEETKQLAIKWVKHYSDLEVVGDMAKYHRGIIEGLKRFFNITEDDLKVTRDLK